MANKNATKVTTTLQLNAEAQISNADKIKRELQQIAESFDLGRSALQKLDAYAAKLTAIQKELQRFSNKQGTFVSNKDIQQAMGLMDTVSTIGTAIQTMPELKVENLAENAKELEDVNKKLKEINEEILKINGRNVKFGDTAEATTKLKTQKKTLSEELEKQEKQKENIRQILSLEEALKKVRSSDFKDKSKKEKGDFLQGATGQWRSEQGVENNIRKLRQANDVLESQTTKSAFSAIDKSIDKTKRDLEEVETMLIKAKKLDAELESQTKAKEALKANITPQAQTSVDTLKSTANAAEQVSVKFNEAAQYSSYFGSTLDEIKGRIGSILSLGFAFDTVIRAIRSASSQAQELDKDMVQIGLVLGQTAGETWKNFDSYSAMAERLNTTTSQVTAAMKLFYQQGLKTAEVNKMVEASAVAAALGESTLAEASETLTSIINSYNLTAEDAISVTDKISAIAIKSAADFGELSTAIEKVASSGAAAGLDLDHMMGYLAKMVETTREAPTNIGTALKTIVANFAQFKQDPSAKTEDGTSINDVDEALKTVGIQLLDSQGNMRDLGEVIDELGKKWDNLTRNQKSYLATTIAGTRQQSRFYALMNDFDRTLELVEEGSNSSGRAMQQFALYEDSLTASTQRLKNEVEIFYNKIMSGNGPLKNLIGILNQLLKIVNKIGPAWTAMGIVGGQMGIRKVSQIFSQLNTNMMKNVETATKFESIVNTVSNNAGKISATDVISQQNFGYNQGNNQAKVSKLQNFGANLGVNLANKFFGVDKSVSNYQGLEAELKELEKLTVEEEKFNITKQKIIETYTLSGQAIEDVTKTKEGEILVTQNGISIGKADALQKEASIANGKVQTAVNWGEVASRLALNLAITAGVAALALIGRAIVKAMNAQHEAAVKAKELANASQEEASSFESLAKSYLKLSKQINLSEEDQKDLESARNALLEQYPSLIAYYDEEGNAIAKNNEQIEEQIKLLKEKAAQDTENAAKQSLNDKKTVIQGGQKEVPWWQFWKRGTTENVAEDADFFSSEVKAASESLNSALEAVENVTVNYQKNKEKVGYQSGNVTKEQAEKILGRDTYLTDEGDIANHLIAKVKTEIASGDSQPALNRLDEFIGLEGIDENVKKAIASVRNSLFNMIEEQTSQYATLLQQGYALDIVKADLSATQESVLNQLLGKNIINELENAGAKTDEEIRNWISSGEGKAFLDKYLAMVGDTKSLEQYTDFVEATKDETLNLKDLEKKKNELPEAYKELGEEAYKSIADIYRNAAKILAGTGGINESELTNEQKKSVDELEKSLSNYSKKSISAIANVYDNLGTGEEGDIQRAQIQNFTQILSQQDLMGDFLEDFENLDKTSATAIAEFKKKWLLLFQDTGMIMDQIRAQGEYYGSKETENVANKYQDSVKGLQVSTGNIDMNNRQVFYDEAGNYMTEESITVREVVDGVITDYIIPSLIDGVPQPEEAERIFREGLEKGVIGPYLASITGQLENGEVSQEFENASEELANTLHLKQQETYSMYSNQAKQILDSFIDTVRRTTEQIAADFAEAQANYSAGGTAYGTSYSDLMGGNVSQETAMKELIKGDASNVYMQNGKLLIQAGDAMAESYKKAKESILNDFDEIEAHAVETFNTQVDTIKEKLGEVGDIDFSNADEVQRAYEGVSEEVRKQVDDARDAAQAEQTRISQVQQLRAQYQDLNTASNQIAKAISENNFVLNGMGSVQNMTNSVKGLAAAWYSVNEGSLSQLDIINMIANNTDLIAALDVQNGKLVLQKEGLEELAKGYINEATAAIDSQIAVIDAQLELLSTDDEVTEKDLENVRDKILASEKEANSEKEAMEDIIDNSAIRAESAIANNKEEGESVSELIEMYNKLARAEAGEEQDTANVVQDRTATRKQLKETKLDTGDLDAKIVDKAAKRQELLDQKKKLEAIKGQLAAYKSNVPQMFKDVNNLIDAGGDHNNDGGGDKDEYEAQIKELETFYNYLRKIERLEEQINRTQKKREIIDSVNNRYIESLKQENSLLQSQTKLYSNYIGAQNAYLDSMRQQISSQYGDWAYFDENGTIQVTAETFIGNTEEATADIENFMDLIDKYQEAYNSREQNLTKLYEIEKQILDNIAEMYEKILSQLDAVTNKLKNVNEQLEHQMEMTTGDLNDLQLLNKELENTAKLWKEAGNTVNSLKGDMQDIQQQVASSANGRYLQWNDLLGQYEVTDEFNNMVNNSETMNSEFADTVTWVYSMAKASEEVSEKLDDANQTLMDSEKTIKSIVDDRLSKIKDLLSGWKDEIVSIFDVINKELDRFSKESSLFGTNGTQRNDQYFQALYAQLALAQKTVSGLRDKQESLLNGLVQDYGRYISVIGDSVYLNEQAIEETTQLNEIDKAMLKERLEAYKQVEEAVSNASDTIYATMEEMQQLYEQGINNIIDLKNQIHDYIMQEDQNELDDLKDKYAEMQRLDNEYYNSLTQKINDAKKAREMEQQQNNIATMQRRAAVLQRDNSGSFSAELQSLNTQIRDALQQQADEQIQMELERIQREQEQHQEDMDMQTRQLENLITFKDENGIYWQETQQMWAEGYQSILGYLSTQYTEEGGSPEEIKQKIDEAKETLNLAMSDFILKFDQYLLDFQGQNLALNTFLAGIMDESMTASDEQINLGLSNLGSVITNLQLPDAIANNTATITQATDNIITNFKTAIDQTAMSTTEANNILNTINADNERRSNNIIGNITTQGRDISAQVGGVRTVNEGIKSTTNTIKETSRETSNNTRGTMGNTARGNTLSEQGNDYLRSILEMIIKVWLACEQTKIILDNRLKRSWSVSLGGAATGKGLSLGAMHGSIYKKGGYVDYTGPAWVDGTSSSPEAFLNAKQTALFEDLRDNLTSTNPFDNNGIENYNETTDNSVNIEKFEMNVKEIAEADSLEKITKIVKGSIYKDATGSKITQARRR